MQLLEVMIKRRDFIKLSGAAFVAGAAPSLATERVPLPTRPVPGTNASLAVIGLGNSSAFRSGDEPVARALLDIFVEYGGNYVDAGGSSAAFVGAIARDMGATDQLFLGNYIDPGEPRAMRDTARRLARAQGKDALDLVHTRDVAGFRAMRDVYRGLKQDGLARYIGVARTGDAGVHAEIAELVETGLVDFIQVNYSMLEPNAGERLLPLARDNDVGVAISRPFINGDYFRLVRGHELPEWAAEFDCETWAQFSLKFILADPAVNCVLTETANPKHALDNLGGGFGRLPDTRMRRRMADHLLSL